MMKKIKEEKTSIQISIKNWKILYRMKNRNESFNDMITKVLKKKNDKEK